MKASSNNDKCALDMLSPEAFAAALLEHAKAVAPEQPPVTRTLERLAPHRATLLELRKQGYSLAQIATFLRDPRFGINISTSSVRRLLMHAPRKRKPAPTAINT